MILYLLKVTQCFKDSVVNGNRELVNNFMDKTVTALPHQSIGTKHKTYSITPLVKIKSGHFVLSLTEFPGLDLQ